jgi:phospholipase/lecithinase/hemolysin
VHYKVQVKSRIYFTALLAFCLSLISIQAATQAAFTSFFVFGDGLSNTATNSGAGQYYYGKRYTNGRTWVEVLAQMQGLPFDPLKNVNSFFGNTSSNLPAQVAAFKPPTDAGNALVVIWVNNADLYYPAYDSAPTFAKFNTATVNALANQQKAITTLYGKGIRTIVMPNVVDISTVPEFNTYASKTNLIRQACTNYNAQFYAMVNKVTSQYPDLLIVVPDYFALLGDMLKSPAKYGVTNALYTRLSIDAISDPSLSDKSLNGQGANYVFWDSTDPTAKVHYIMACIAQQLVSPVQIGMAQMGDLNRIDMINVPVGMNGFLENSTNLATGWTVVTNFSSPALAQSLFITAPPLPADFGTGGGDASSSSSGGGLDPTDPRNWISGTNSVKPIVTATQLYRLRFPYNWVWP